MNKNIYRFLWLRSFHRPVVITLVRSGDQVILHTKLLDKQPDFLDHRIDPRGWPDLDEEIKGRVIEKFSDSLMVIKADRKADIVYDTTKICTLKNWDEFELLIRKVGFWQIPVQGGERGNDGAEWIMEGHFKDKYRFIARWTPQIDFRDAGLYLIKLSGLKEKIY